MTLAELSLHLQSLNVNNMKVLVGHNVFVVTIGQSSNNASHTVSASDPELETATGQALALWERVNQPTER